MTMAVLSFDDMANELVADLFTELATSSDGSFNGTLVLDGETQEYTVRAIKDLGVDQRINDFVGQTAEEVITISLFKDDCPNNEPPVLDSTVEINGEVFLLKQLILKDANEYRYIAIELPT